MQSDPRDSGRAGGDGPASPARLLVLHGGSGRVSVDSIAARLGDRYSVEAPTHPGWDDRPVPEQATVALLAADYLRARGRRDAVILIGSSFGGWIAAEIALQAEPDQVVALVLIDAIGPVLDGPPPDRPSGSAPTPAPRGLRLVATYAGPAMGDPTLLERLAQVTVPVLVLWGEQDPVVPVEYGRAYASAFPNSTFVTIEGAGHLPMLDAPETVFAILDDFLASTNRSNERNEDHDSSR